ncbi:MCE family protein [Carboxylicivirga sediminis]|uniref:MCE family protein n=1 Tax=Carboxylicivirga sediminis TaxID=2006564 RepID=A0A941F190_9BACT|nr:MlaD family protein [Carboxylicivirga sediminis]MBR8534911.1 MCE family protein [Carboxylicivirga sediminis]
MKKEVKIGLTVFVSFIIVIWGFNFLKGHNLIEVGNSYYGVYDRIDGLTKASPVYFRGFKVGTVRDIDFHPTQPNRFLVTFTLFDEIGIPNDSKAQIYSLDLMGTKGVQFIIGHSDQMLAVGDTMNTSVVGDLADKMSMEVLPLKDKTERLIVKLDTVLTNIGQIFSEEKSRFHSSMYNLDRSLRHFESISRNLAKKLEDDGEVTMMLQRTDSLVAMLSAQRPHIDSTFSNLAGFSQQLEDANIDATVEQLRSTLSSANDLLDSINDGKGSLGKLMSDDEFYYSLNEVSNSLNRLLIDFRHNPDRYVSFSAVNFGRKVVVTDQAYGVGGIVYEIQILESKAPIKMDSTILDGKYKIFEDYRDSKYVYNLGQTRYFDEASKILDEVKDLYDEASIVALENGVPISLKKARRKAK